MIKIVLVQEWLPPYRVELFKQIRREFSEHSVDFQIVVGGQSEKYIGRESYQGTLDFATSVTRRDFKVGHARISVARIRKLLSDADLVVFEQARRNLYLYPLLSIPKLLRKRKLLLWGHGKDHHASSFLSKKLLLWLTNRSDGLLLYKSFENGGKSEGIEVPLYEIGNSVYSEAELEEIRNVSSRVKFPPQFLFLGSISKDKKIEDFIEAARISHNLNLNYSFVVAGIGPDFDWIKSQATGNVHFVGSVQGSSKSKLISESVCLVIPDAIGLVAIDALAHGKYIFTNSAAGIHGPEFLYALEADIIKHYSDASDLVSQLESLVKINSRPEIKRRAESIETIARNFVGSCLRALDI